LGKSIELLYVLKATSVIYGTHRTFYTDSRTEPSDSLGHNSFGFSRGREKTIVTPQ